MEPMFPIAVRKVKRSHLLPGLILGIDPGTYRSAYVVWRPRDFILVDKGWPENDEMIDIIKGFQSAPPQSYIASRMIVEMVGHYGTGMATGKTTYETCVWIGRFIQAWQGKYGSELILRKTVVTQLCGVATGADANVRQALIDRYGPTGTKKNPGRLYGVKTHIWQALGVAVAWADIVVGD